MPTHKPSEDGRSSTSSKQLALFLAEVLENCKQVKLGSCENCEIDWSSWEVEPGPNSMAESLEAEAQPKFFDEDTESRFDTIVDME